MEYFDPTRARGAISFGTLLKQNGRLDAKAHSVHEDPSRVVSLGVVRNSASNLPRLVRELGSTMNAVFNVISVLVVFNGFEIVGVGTRLSA